MWSPLGFHTATYLLKLFLEQTISTKFCDLLHMFCWFVCTKTKVTNITSEWQSSYNQNNFIILMKFNRNNVGIEDNFQVSSFTAFRLNNRMSTNMCDTTVQGFQSFFYNKRYFLNFRRYLKNLAGGLGPARGPQWVQG